MQKIFFIRFFFSYENVLWVKWVVVVLWKKFLLFLQSLFLVLFLFITCMLYSVHFRFDFERSKSLVFDITLRFGKSAVGHLLCVWLMLCFRCGSLHRYINIEKPQRVIVSVLAVLCTRRQMYIIPWM